MRRQFFTAAATNSETLFFAAVKSAAFFTITIFLIIPIFARSKFLSNDKQKEYSGESDADHLYTQHS